MLLEHLISEGIMVTIFLINLLFAISLVFFERKNPSATIAWLAVLFFIPILGFILYLIFGQTFHREKMFKVKAELDKEAKSLFKEQLKELKAYKTRPSDEELDKYLAMAHLLLVNDMALLTENNQIHVYTDGNAKFNALQDAIKKATQHIHIEYYIIRNDNLGHKIVAALAAKAKEGVEVRLIYDGLGCARLPRNFFKELTDAGGQVAGFFERKIPLLKKRVNYNKNYRDHRKIVVIDGTTGFVGGFNIDDEYLGKGPLGYWRDTHLKLNGYAVDMLQIRFFQDWSFVAKEVLDFETNAFIYGREIAVVLKTAFENDIKQSTEITKQLYSERSTRVKIKESISRLFSAAL